MPLQSTELFDARPAQALIGRHQKISYPFTCTFGEATLTIQDGVFCPTLTNASPLLLRCIDFRPGEHVLDAFAGSGAFGIIAAMRGSSSVTIDLSPLAAACTILNAKANNVSDRVEVRLGTVAGFINPDEVFDLIVANPPLLPGTPDSLLSSALFDPGLEATLDFIAMLPWHLSPWGRCYIITSNVFERCCYDMESICSDLGMRATRCRDEDHGYESYRVHKITRIHA